MSDERRTIIELKRAVEALRSLSRILQSLEAKGLELTEEGERQWIRATIDEQRCTTYLREWWRKNDRKGFGFVFKAD